MEGASFAWEQNMLESQRDYVERQLDAGVPVDTVAGDLERMGVEAGRARAFVASLAHPAPFAPAPAADTYGFAPAATPAAATPVRAEPAAVSTVVLTALGAGVAAGVLLGLIILTADLKFFLIGVPVGLAVGYALRHVAPGSQDTQTVLIALGGTIIGVVIARYFVWIQAWRDASRQLAHEQPNLFHELSASSLFTDRHIMSAFFQHPGLAFGWRGGLTLVLGCVLAVRTVTRD